MVFFCFFDFFVFPLTHYGYKEEKTSGKTTKDQKHPFLNSESFFPSSSSSSSDTPTVVQPTSQPIIIIIMTESTEPSQAEPKDFLSWKKKRRIKKSNRNEKKTIWIFIILSSQTQVYNMQEGNKNEWMNEWMDVDRWKTRIFFYFLCLNVWNIWNISNIVSTISTLLCFIQHNNITKSYPEKNTV